ncbi:MAG: Gfo/Idh/MocA family oxidoreductase [Treponema sp.]|jgi:predicted dehydrogenase|nr:Gfo/Idh/MocA family oxidoreductase [Treponema sp.]
MLKIGLVGLGGIGQVHLSTYQHLEDCTVAAVCDPSQAGRERAKAKGIPCYEDLGSLLKAETVDVVDVCVPSFLHRDCVMEALTQGLPVICEKPLALSGAQVREMYALAEQKGVPLFVGHVVQFQPASRALHAMVKDGRFGRALDAVFLRLSACPKWAAGGWLFDKTKSGLLPFDLHIHDLDLIISLFGKPEKYEVFSGGREGIGYQEYYRFLYRYQGLNVCAEAAWYNGDIPFTASWRVYFEKAVVWYDGNKLIAYKNEGPPEEFDIEEKIKIPTGINLPPTGIFYEELGLFLNRIRAEDKTLDRRDEIIALIDILENIVRESP